MPTPTPATHPPHRPCPSSHRGSPRTAGGPATRQARPPDDQGTRGPVVPWATLGINVSGCFVLAFVLVGPAASRLSITTTTAIAVGLLGGYTTFSTFGYETFTLVRTGRTAVAVCYVVLSLLGGLAATALGYATGRAVA